MTQLTDVVHYFSRVLDAKGQVDVVFLDFKKAFDKVSHQKLMNKLELIKKKETPLAWGGLIPF